MIFKNDYYDYYQLLVIINNYQLLSMVDFLKKNDYYDYYDYY